MTESNTPAQPSDPSSPVKPPAKRRGWGRRIICIGGGLIVVAGVLVALGPTIASTGAVKSAVLSRVNSEFLDGKVEIANWNFGWFGVQTVQGIKLYDSNNALVAEVPTVTVDKSLVSAIGDAFAFGKVRVEGARANLVINEDGSLNVEGIAKSSAKSSKKEFNLSKPIDIPNVIGEIEIVNASASLVSPGGKPPVSVSQVNGVIKLPGGDAPITNTFDLTTFVGDGSGGKVFLNGSIAAVKNGQIVLDQAGVKQELTISDIPVNALQPFLPAELVDRLTGRANGGATFELVDGKQATVNGKFTIAKLSASGPVLKGDTLSTESTEVILSTITITMPNGPADLQAMRLTTGSEQQPITLAMDQGKATLFADVPPNALVNLLAGKAAAGDGSVVVTANFDAGKIVPQLPNTLKLVEGVSLTGGKLDSKTTITLTPASLILASSTALTDVAGQNTTTNTPISLKPIQFDIAASSADVTNPLVSLRDISLTLASGFANGNFTGPTLAGLNGKLSGTLDAVQAEAGQIVDFGGTKLSGAFDATIATTGDLTKTQTEPATLQADLTIGNLNVIRDGAKPIHEPMVVGNLRADILTGEDGLPVSADIVKASIDASNAATFTLAADATAKIVRNGDAIDLPAFAVNRFAINLDRIVNEGGAIVPAIRQYGQGLTGELRAQLKGSATNVFAAPAVQLASMQVQHSQGLIEANVTEPLDLSLPAGTLIPQGNGKITWRADLAAMNPIVRNRLRESATNVDVQTGTVAGVITFDRAMNAAATSITIDGETSTLTLAMADGKSVIEPLTFGLTASATDDLSSFSVDRAAARGPALVASAKLKGSKTGERIDVTSFDVAEFKADTGKLGQLAEAFLPAKYRQYASALPGSITANLSGKATDITNAPAIELVTLQASHSAGLFKINADGPFAVSLPAGSTIPHASGKLNAALDLPQANQLLRKVIGQEIVASSTTGDVKTGALAGVLSFTRPNATSTGVIADFTLNNLAISGTDGGVTNFQPVKLSLNAVATDDLSRVTIADASAQGDLLNASITKTVLHTGDFTKPDSKFDPLKVVESASASLVIPDLQPIYALAKNFMTSLGATPAPGEAVGAEPLAVTGGSFSTKATVTRGADGLPNVNVSEISGKNIRATMGGSTYEIASINGSQTVLPNAEGTTLSPKGKITINGVKFNDNTGKVLFAEEAVELANDVSLDVNKMDATINAFTLNTTSSGAMSLSAKGAVRDVLNARRFDNLTADVTYDPAVVAQLAKPFIAADPTSLLADLTAASEKVTRQWLVTGSMPADKSFNESIKSVIVDGGVALATATVQGNTVADIDLGVKLVNGQATVKQLKPATFNGGALNIDGTTIDLSDPFAPRLSMPKGQQLVKGAAVNPYLINNTLGQINPLFSKALTAEGSLNATVVEFNRVPLSALLTQNASQNDGVAKLEFNINNMKLGNPLVSTILKFTGNRATLDGEVRSSTATLAGGIATTSITYAAIQGEREYPLRIAGDVGLSTFNIGQMNLVVLTEALQNRGDDAAKYLPAEMVIPVTGAVDSPNVDFAGAVNRNITAAVKKAAEEQLKDKLLGELFKKDKDKKSATGDQKQDDAVQDKKSDEEKTVDAMKDLFNLGKKKDKDKK